MADILDLSALEISDRIGRGVLKPSELMRATLDRIAKVNGAVNAIVSLRDAGDLMAEALAADDAPREGWLHGMPLAVKDLVATKGIVTSWGSPAFADHVPVADDLLARRLKAAGAILIGKTNVPEFGLGSHSYNPVFGVTRTPYDLSRSAGGSSGGAGAALATRMVSVADGSDMMGSLRNPGAWNNVYGMRPSHGLVPMDPVGEMILHPLATLGPMARCPADLAALLETLAGPDDLQPVGAEFIAGDLTVDLKGKRIGWLGDWGGAYAMEPGILPLCEAALGVFEGLGAQVKRLDPIFRASDIWASWVGLRSWAIAHKLGEFYDDPARKGLLKPEAIWEIENGRSLDNAEILRLSSLRSDWFRASARALQEFDALVMPTAQVWPFPAEWDWPKEINGQAMDTYHRWMEVVIAVSLLGLPAVNLPVGFGENGLPMGMQIFGPRGADRRILQIAQSYHEQTDWPGTHPPAL